MTTPEQKVADIGAVAGPVDQPVRPLPKTQADLLEALRVERVVLAELALKTSELIEHLQKTGRLKPCFYMPALVDARNALAN